MFCLFITQSYRCSSRHVVVCVVKIKMSCKLFFLGHFCLEPITVVILVQLLVYWSDEAGKTNSAVLRENLVV